MGYESHDSSECGLEAQSLSFNGEFHAPKAELGWAEWPTRVATAYSSMKQLGEFYRDGENNPQAPAWREATSEIKWPPRQHLDCSRPEMTFNRIEGRRTIHPIWKAA